MIASRHRAHLLIVDVQARLAPHIAEAAEVERNVLRLARGAELLSIPVTASEHYATGLGATAVSVRAALPATAAVLPKITFSCCREPPFAERLDALRRAGRREIAIAGMEAHVCVMQTALDLITKDFDVYVVRDAVGSRRTADRDAAIERLGRAGAAIVTTEMLLFEWAERGDIPQFKDLLALVK